MGKGIRLFMYVSGLFCMLVGGQFIYRNVSGDIQTGVALLILWRIFALPWEVHAYGRRLDP